MSIPRLLYPARQGGHWHYCPGCEAVHRIGNEWNFNHNWTKPTFDPSVWHNWTGSRVPGEKQCHYFIKNGELQYCDDSTHAFAGKTIPLPIIPPQYDAAYFSG